MSIPRHHSEWLSLIEVSGPFLSVPVLMRVFPQGLDAHDPQKLRTLKLAYEEWEENNDARHRTNPAVHGAWNKFILTNTLGLPENVILEQQAIPQSLQCSVAEHGELLRPSIVIANPATHSDANNPRLLVQVYSADQDLSKSVHGKTWKASPGTRMMELLHATGVRLGLVTNGEEWMLVDAPKNETTGFASWYANGWIDYGEDDHAYLRSFTSLLGVERFFNAADANTLERMLHESASNQQEVTEQLGYQVRRAVEVLVESLDKADQDHGRELLQSIPETEIYEAALTVMMRLVFLFSAEERGLLLLNDELYARNYALSTIREQLRKTADDHGEEILERRHDAWCRLLSTFRAVFGGVKHDRLNLPAYGGRLFDPDRFAFLEGRKKGTSWKNCEADPLPVNNRTVLHLLDALQLLRINGEARRLSFRALDIEQIGHVYEGMLDHTAKRATEPMLGLIGTREKEPEVPLAQLEELKSKGDDKLIEFLREESGKSPNALAKALAIEVDLHSANHFQAVCGNDGQLLKRVAPFAGIVRDDSFGYPVVIPVGSIFVTAGTNRRSSGTHYTPRSLTEPIVQYTLEPLVYIGPAEGKPKEQWKLRTAKELLELKICDLACGSGAFLVQGCRYLSERLVEAWEIAERNHPSPNPGKLPFPTIMAEGKPSSGAPGETLIPTGAEERMAYAKRLVAQRCLYGVDINPLAVEMAKLSLWLLTLAKDKPFTFLDHAIRCGDSLVGINDLKQLKTFSLDGLGQQYVFGEQPLDNLVDEAVQQRLQIESMPITSVENVETQGQIMAECDRRMELLRNAADLLIAAELKSSNTRDRLHNRDGAAIKIGHFLKLAQHGELSTAASQAMNGQRRFHWPLEFPEVMCQKNGFDGIVGNPPFLGGIRISGVLGDDYLRFLQGIWGAGNRADLCAYFFRRARQILRSGGSFGLLGTNTLSQGDSRQFGLDRIASQGCTFTRAISSRPWPGTASLEVSHIWGYSGSWQGEFVLNDSVVERITTYLTEAREDAGPPLRLAQNAKRSFKGCDPLGIGFILSSVEAETLLRKDRTNAAVVKPFLNGQDLNSRPNQSASRWAINFHDWPLDRSTAPSDYVGAVASDFPECLSIVAERVKPVRCRKNEAGDFVLSAPLPQKWWLFNRPRMELYETVRTLKRAIIRPELSNTHAMVFLSADVWFSNQLCVFAFDSASAFSVMQSSLHEAWARFYGSTMRTDMRYTTVDCFETFPFPRDTDETATIGELYSEHRRQMMLAREEGLTTTCNRMDDPEDVGADVKKLRELHAEMDKAVAAAYGWTTLVLGHGFHQTKQGTRFTISEAARREVLARLLKLNHERYAEEVAQGLHDKKKAKDKKTVREKSSNGSSLFEIGDES